MPQKYEQLT